MLVSIRQQKTVHDYEHVHDNDNDNVDVYVTLTCLVLVDVYEFFYISKRGHYEPGNTLSASASLHLATTLSKKQNS
jgi:hypothetical protein